MPREYRRKPRRPGAKLLGLDLGERRVGVAVSDDTGVIASPLKIVDLKRQSLEDVASLASELFVDGIVIGLPRGMRGDEGYQARETRSMAAQIEAFVSVPIIFWDERLTSAIADRVLAAHGKSSRARRGERDAIAAAVMLQSYLDAHPLPDRRPSAGE
ncbi:MAG TPA: Holliday junction resolvase RuvX [Thermomicrobiales bacterium]|nr:Holliday junction resolvase RuvX [Thermomicrobiales bacterium]